VDELIARLAAHDVLALDTSIFIYHFESHPRYRTLTRFVLDQIQSGRSLGVTSVITLMELTVHPWRQQKPAVAQEYEMLLVNFPNLTIPDVDRSIVRRAAQLRAIHNLQPADALHVATALCHNATGFVTNNLRLQRLEDQIDVIMLDRFRSN
jgi:predicted nucleic acid-binding protein